MPKLPPIVYTIFFALCFAVTAFFLFDLHQSHQAIKSAVESLETGIKKDIEDLQKQGEQLETDYNDLQDSDTGLKNDVEQIRRTKADKKKESDDKKNAVDSYTADSLYRVLARRYGDI